MRVNIYAEEMTDRIEIISKEIDGQTYTGCRFYLELPVSLVDYGDGRTRYAEKNDRHGVVQYKGAFYHRPGDDDSSAVTFWGKRDLRDALRKALTLLDAHYREQSSSDSNPEESR